MPTTPDHRRKTVALVYTLAGLSGSAALVYEIAWARMLSLTFGSTTLSAAAVIAAFMGGMGIGAWAGGRLKRETPAPLALYGWIEIGIAVSTALLTLTFYRLPAVFAEWSRALPAGALPPLRFLAVFVLLLVPAVLMGATFPTMCRVLIRSAGQVDRRLGFIYGINTIGAAAGAMVGGIVLIEAFGLFGAVYVANVINIAVGVAALFAHRRTTDFAEEREVPQSEAVIPTQLPRQLTGAVLLLSGFTTLSYEIVWFRGLQYVVGNSSYALTVVLAVFLAGLGLGSLLLRRALRWTAPERALAYVQLAIALLSLTAMAVFVLLLGSESVRQSVSIFSRAVLFKPWWQRLLADAGMAAVVMLPGTIAMGLSYPLATRLYLGDVRHLGARVGGAYLLANLGSIAGAIAGAAVLLPAFGTVGAVKVIMAVNLAAAIAVLAAHRARIGREIPVLAGAGAFLATLCVVLPSALTLRGEEITDGVEGVQVFAREGDLATVQVLAMPDNPNKRVMSIDGCKIGWNDGFVGETLHRKQVMLGHLPMLLDTRIRRTLNVGLGSACTLRSLATYPQVETLDCVEISAAVVEASRYFEASSVLQDARVRLRVEDAVHDLLRTHSQYDAIISDGKQDPFFSGNATLLCREFYALARDDMSPDGLFVQWIPLGTLSLDFKVILRTFCEAFPCVEVFFLPRDSVFLVGSLAPLAGRPAMTAEEFQTNSAGRELTPYYLESPNAILAHWIGSKAHFLPALAGTPVSTWDRLILDFSVYKAPASDRAESALVNLRFMLAIDSEARRAPSTTFLPADTAFRESTRLVHEAWAEHLAGRTAEAVRLAEQAVQVNPDDRDALGVWRVMQWFEQTGQ